MSRIRLSPSSRALTFGFANTLAATVGQTLLISLFLPGLRDALALQEGDAAFAFTAATVASAAALWKVGRWIDRIDVVRYAVGSAAFLALSCMALALTQSYAVFVAALFCLRLAGNGLLTHVALTSTARYFTRDRGRALAWVLLGSAVGEACLPAILLPTIDALGWRLTFAVTGFAGLCLVGAAALLVTSEPGFRHAALHATDIRAESAGTHGRSPPPIVPDPWFFWRTALLFVVMPVVVTATVFHQALVAEAKGVSLQWFAGSFVAFALSRVVSSLFAGRLADRYGSTALLVLHPLPLALGIALLVLVDSTWVVPLFWCLAGVAGGIGGVVHMTALAERMPIERLGHARSVISAVGIVAAAAGPSLYGLGLRVGAEIDAILWTAVAALLIATLIGGTALRRGSPRARL